MIETIRNELLVLAEPTYQRFAMRLLPGTDHLLGVRLPKLRQMARKISKRDYEAYLQNNDELYFEEIMLKGMIIGYIKVPLDAKLELIRQFVPKINNWSVCDSFCSGLKFTKDHQMEVWTFLQPYFQSSHEFEVRFAVVMALIYYIEDLFIESVLETLDQVKHQGYYAQMAVAWAISICFIKQEKKTQTYLENHSLDPFTYQKALQKIIESNQVDKKTKARIKKMKKSER
ncbi:DNA alkylation repair protein [Turicibacter sp.]|uniref:DNA alkylation repair protein n=1 Tax=Turicibacter sp. TaxID=2049042 RepID=UPI001B73EB00|nr:DNA alkylation repair protein [Turicibacter sp.]MBP3904575.1 DNA alkylation repair protein [Turicibacter sp.]